MLGPLFAMQDPAEIDLDLMLRLKRERDGQLHAWTQTLDLVQLGVAEPSVLDEYLQGVVSKLVPIRTSSELGCPRPDKRN